MTLGGACALTRIPIPTLGSYPVAVPSDFVGLCYRSWPIANPLPWKQDINYPFPADGAAGATYPAPTNIKVGCVRLHDTPGGYPLWYNIETTVGVYDWSKMDQIVTAHRALGQSVLFTLAGTPAFYATGATSTLDSYGIAGGLCYPGSASPNGLTGLSNFFTAMITRYNGAGGAWRLANPTLGKGIKFIEIWNEPFITAGFYSGTLAQLVDIGWTINQAVKAVDATVTIIAPGDNQTGVLATWLATTGAINTTKTGANCCDAFGFHQYQDPLPYTNVGPDWIANLLGIQQTTAQTGLNRSIYAFRAISGPQGTYPNVPFYITETSMGYDQTAGNGLSIALAQPPAWRYQYWARKLMISAAFGNKMHMLYTWDTVFSTYAANDPTGIAQALTDIHNNVAGKTISSAFYNVGAEVTLNFSDGTSFTV